MKNKDTYLQLLRTAIGFFVESASSGECLALSDEKLNTLLRLCQQQGTGPLVFDQLLRTLPNGYGVREEMKQMCMQNILLQSRWEQAIEQVWDALTKKDAPLKHQPILLKGFGLAQLYPKPYLRQWGDLDVWVGTDDYHEACRRLREAFPDAEHNEEEDEEFKHYCLVLAGGMVIEVHRVSMTFASRCDMEYYHQLELAGMQGGPKYKVGNIEVQCPKDEFNLLFVFLHAWEHFAKSGMSMKLVCDMALLAHYAYGIESESVRKAIEDYLRPALKRLHVWEVWGMVGYVVVKTLGLPMNEWPLYGEGRLEKGKRKKEEGRMEKDGGRLMAKILEEGQSRKHTIAFGAKTNEEAAEIARQMSIVKRKWLTLKNRIEAYRFMREYAPTYARHELWANIAKGIDRTIHRKAMAKYF